MGCPLKSGSNNAWLVAAVVTLGCSSSTPSPTESTRQVEPARPAGAESEREAVPVAPAVGDTKEPRVPAVVPGTTPFAVQTPREGEPKEDHRIDGPEHRPKKKGRPPSRAEQADPSNGARRETPATVAVSVSGLPVRSPAESRRCSRFSTNEALVKCAGEWKWVHEMRLKPGAPLLCRDVWLLEGTYYDTMDAAIDSVGCERKCIYEPGSIADGTHCGRGYWLTTFRPLKPRTRRSCPPLYQDYGGLHESLEALQDWAAKNPCLDAGSKRQPRPRAR